MKKITCIIACLISYNLCADDLLEAIRANDVQAVTRSLDQKTFSPDRYDIYLNALEESLWMIKEQIFMQWWRPKSDDMYSSLYLCSVLASLGGFTWAASNNNHSWIIFFMALPFIALPLAVKGTEQVTKTVQQHYKDALHIQDLILTTFADLT